MSGLILFRSEAEADLTEAALWYNKPEAGLGLALLSEVRAATRRALEDPLLYPLAAEMPGSPAHSSPALSLPYLLRRSG